MIALKLTNFKYIPTVKIIMNYSTNFDFTTQQQYIDFNCYKMAKAV